MPSPKHNQESGSRIFLHVTIANDHMSLLDRGEWSNQKPELVVSPTIIELKYNLCADVLEIADWTSQVTLRQSDECYANLTTALKPNLIHNVKVDQVGLYQENYD